MDEQLFPIDIHYNKLLDWLIDRRHCDLKWHSAVREIRARVTRALGELPQTEDFARATRHHSLNYFHCLRIVELLKSTEGEEKTIFGQYTNPRLWEWADILKQYEKKNVYLAECAQQLIRNVNYEIPALKSQISKCQQTQRECVRKEGECNGSSAAQREKFKLACREMGIEGNNVREELAQLVAELPSLFDQLLAELPNILPAIYYYQSFVQHTTNRERGESSFLPTLSFVLKEGNVTVHQWKYGTPPPELEPDTSQTQNQPVARLEPEHGNGTQGMLIDWGDDSTSTTQQLDGIDFGESGIESGIDFNIDSVDLSGITIEDSGEGEETGSDDHTHSQPAAKPRHTSTNPDHERVLEATQTRNMFVDDLLELREFLAQRLREMETESSSLLLLDQFGSGSESMEFQSKETIQEMLGHVTRALDLLTNSRVQHLFLIRGSPSYLDRLTSSLLHQLQLATRAASQAQSHATKREEATAIALSLEPKLKSLVDQTKELQSQISGDISKRYSNRVVNIMGEINQI